MYKRICLNCGEILAISKQESLLSSGSIMRCNYCNAKTEVKLGECILHIPLKNIKDDEGKVIYPELAHTYDYEHYILPITKEEAQEWIDGN